MGLNPQKLVNCKEKTFCTIVGKVNFTKSAN